MYDDSVHATYTRTRRTMWCTGVAGSGRIHEWMVFGGYPVTTNVTSLKDVSLCHQVVELGFDSCDNASNDRFWNARKRALTLSTV